MRSSAMHDDDTDPYIRKEYNVLQDIVPDLGIVQYASAVFNDKDLAAECMDIGNSFDQDRSFFNNLVHRLFFQRSFGSCLRMTRTLRPRQLYSPLILT